MKMQKTLSPTTAVNKHCLLHSTMAPTDLIFLTAVRDASLDTLVASGNLQLLQALQELDLLR